MIKIDILVTNDLTHEPRLSVFSFALMIKKNSRNICFTCSQYLQILSLPDEVSETFLIFLHCMYAICDIETTGGNHRYEKITEIAIFLHDGSKVIDEFSTLINPERNIPNYITNLTGITNEMVADAPKFYEVAKKIVEITENSVFIGHNVTFDYHFVREEFARLGYDFNREVLCTVKMSRKLIPGKRSYSLGNICDDLGIVINDRHRAAGDALATVKLFELLMNIAKDKPNISSNFKELSRKNLHPAFDTALLDKLPHQIGVYYLLNEKNDIIYIGKSNDIHDRILTHFNNIATKKALDMKGQITDIGYEITGSELVALLLESFEIKKHKPLFNRAQRRTTEHFGIYTYTDNGGYIHFFIDKNKTSDDTPLASFNSQTEAKIFLTDMVEKFKLCQKLSGLYNSQQACFHFQIGGCNGACVGKESSQSYNVRANHLIHYFGFENENFWIIGHGRNKDEHSIVRVKNGKYLGFGYIGNDIPVTNTQMLADCLKKYPDNNEVQQIIKTYLKKHPGTRVIYDQMSVI